MEAHHIRVDYEEVKTISVMFNREVTEIRAARLAIARQVGDLRSGDWVGEGASRFLYEMDSDVMPALERLELALLAAAHGAARIETVMHNAELAAARVLMGISSPTLEPRVGSGPAFEGGGDPFGDIIRFIKDVLDRLGLGQETPQATPVPTNTSGPPVTPEQAEAIFEDMANEKDIAFNYPPDGCYARAHMMTTRIRETYGVEPSKVWAFGDLSVDTNGPYGSVRWGYHVAPVLPVLQPDGTVVNMVIDPSIARRPISVNEWKAIMHAPTADTQITLLGQPPTNASTGKPYPGTGYWPGQDPYNGDLDAYSAEVMRRYLEAGEKGTDDVVPPSPRR